MENKEQTTENQGIFQKLLDAGVHLGRKKSVGHPNMKPYVLTVRNNVQIINIEKTVDALAEASEFLKSIVASGGTVLFVSVSMPAKDLVKKLALELNMPYTTDRWIGGTLTNFGIISKRIRYYLDTISKKEKGELEKYTKKERLLIEEELKDLEKKIGGISSLTKLPSAIFMVDAGEHAIAIKEANETKVPVVAVTNTNADPKKIQYAIPANDKSIKSLEVILAEIKTAIEEGKKGVSKKTQETK